MKQSEELYVQVENGNCGNNVLSNYSARTVAVRKYEKYFWSNYHVVHGTCDETQCNLVGVIPGRSGVRTPVAGIFPIPYLT